MKRQVGWALISCLLLACDDPAYRPRKIVYVIDVTASLKSDTHAGTIDSLVRMVPTLNRGDELVVVPVTDDAQNESLTQIVRLRIPLHREPYDADLRRAMSEAEDKLQQLLKVGMARRYQRTDLLGAFRLAAEELEQPGGGTLAHLVCISDFLQDDQQFDFKRDPSLGQSSSAKRLATRLAHPHGSRFRGIVVFLGSVSSLDARRLTPARRDAVREFWVEFLQIQGAVVRWKTDGIGHMADFLDQVSHDQSRYVE
jgi:hypothetical protein